MADEAPIDLPIDQPAAARHYSMLCLLMLLVLTVLLVERVPDAWSALPLLFGTAFLVIRWREGPAVVLFLVAWLLAAENLYGDPPTVFRILLLKGFRTFAHYARTSPAFDDFLLAGAFLLYAASHYRYLGFVRHVFPLDPRQRPYGGLASAERRRLLEEPQRRSQETMTPREFGLLAAVVPLWLGGAALLWTWALAEQRPSYVFDDVLWSALKLLYLFGVPLLIFRAVLIYANQRQASHDENLMYLQEQVWRETRREQSRTNRWLTWARLRAQRRKEKS